MQSTLQSRWRQPQGAAMLMTLMFVMISTIAITAWLHLMASRLRQSETMSDATQRHLAWGNMQAINQQYTYTYALRDKNSGGSDGSGVTRTASTATPVTKWGGIDAEAYTNLKAFRSTRRPAGATVAYPYNNIIPLPTTDKAVYYERINGDSDGSQTEHVSMINYLKTYPSVLLGDLLHLHKRPSGSPATSYTDNLYVQGRTVVSEPTTAILDLRTDSYIYEVDGGAGYYMKPATGSTALLPQNFPVSLSTTAGMGSGNTAAVTDGSLNMINNADFTPGSIRHIMELGGTTAWMTCGTAATNTSTHPYNFNTTPTGTTKYPSAASDAAADLLMKVESSSAYGTYGLISSSNTATDNLYTYITKTAHLSLGTPNDKLNVLYIRLNNSGLKHIRITGGVEQVIIEGQLNTTEYNARDTEGTYPARIIWIEQATMPDIRFVGENNRRFILATGRGSGAYLHCAFASTSSALGGNNPIRWRMHWINEYRHIWITPPTPTAVNALITGSIRTDYSLQCTDNGSTTRFTLARETVPGALETLLPRDGWVEPYFHVQ